MAEMGRMWGSPRGKNLKLLAVRPEGNSPLLPPLDIEHAFKAIRHYFNGQFSPLQPTFNALDIGTTTALDAGKRGLYHAPYVLDESLINRLTLWNPSHANQ